MSVKEVLQALGNWGITLKPETPREVVSEIEQNKFGHIAIIPGRINPLQYGDGLLREARYVGVYRSTFKQSDDTVEIKGVGMNFWLGDEDDKGAIFETPVVLTAATFPDAIRALLPNSVQEGTLYSIPGAGTYTNTHQWETPRKAISYITDTYTTSAEFTGIDRIVEYRVNGDATLDAGPIENLYNMTPKAILVKKDTGRDMRLLGLQADMSMDYDVEDLTTRVVLLAEGEGQTMATGSADASPTGFVDLFGNPIKMTRLVSESSTPSGNANTRAQLQLIRWSLPRQAIQIRTQEFDIKGDFVCGDYIYVFDPESGFFDLNNEVYWRGQPINPLALRVKEMDWGVRSGWTVAFRKKDGTWMDLSEYYKPENVSSTLAVGDYRRTLAGNNYEPISFRPNLPNSGADSTIPDAPTFTGFSTGVYEADGRTLSAVRAQWSQPLNTDSSTIVDGDHYEIRYRPNAVIGTSVPWDYLSGGYNVDFTSDFTADQTNGWGPSWQAVSTASDLSVSGGEGRIAHPSFNILRGLNVNGQIYTDVEVVRSGVIDYAPAGGNTNLGVRLRNNSGIDYYHCVVELQPGGGVRARISKFASNAWWGDMGVVTVPGLTYTPGQKVWIKATAIGKALSMKVWTGTAEDEPQRDALNLMDTAPLTSGAVSVLDYISPSSTNPTGSVTKTDDYIVRSLVPDNPGSAYSWDDLGSWDAITSEPVAASPSWQTTFIGWDSNSITIMELSPGIQYEFQIRAVDAAVPPNFGAWSVSTFVNTLGDVIAPSTPAMPEVAASMIGIQIVHTLGKSSGGIFNLEQDLDHLEVHTSHIQTFLPSDDTKVGEIIATGAMVRAEIPAVGSFKVDQANEVWVKVIAVDRSGNKSAASESVQSTIVLIDDAHISDLTVSKVTAGTITATWIMAGAIKTSETGARVEVDAAGVRAYDPDGNNTVNVESATGKGTFTGTLQTKVNGAGVKFYATVDGGVENHWSVNDASGVPLDHKIRAFTWDQGGLFGQTYQMSVTTDTFAQDGSKLLMTEGVTVLSHQPASGNESYLAMGNWPGGGVGLGRIYMKGKFERAWVLDNQGAIWTNNQLTNAGFSGQTHAYGFSMPDLMTPCYGLWQNGGSPVAYAITAISSTGFTFTWSDAAAHRSFIWVPRVESA